MGVDSFLIRQHDGKPSSKQNNVLGILCRQRQRVNVNEGEG